MMLGYTGTGRAASSAEHHLEHRYCLAKLGELGGREDVYIQHDRVYASRALVHLRQTCAYVTVPSTVRQAVGEIPKDGIASRLPGKYRRAYRFILSNQHREDLSIREVADAVGVTERALQLNFRAVLGLPPSAVIRQCRMQCLRDELHRGAVGHGTTTLDVGRRWGPRWGPRSRSALSRAQKATFGELPSHTLSASPGRGGSLKRRRGGAESPVKRPAERLASTQTPRGGKAGPVGRQSLLVVGHVGVDQRGVAV